MQTLPRTIPETPEEAVSGLTCPDCFGALSVHREGSRDLLIFRCRIGHAYSAEEVIVGKEKVVETYLWAAVTALEELSALLRELADSGRAGAQRDEYDRRAGDADEQGRQIRAALEAHAAIGLKRDVATNEGA